MVKVATQPAENPIDVLSRKLHLGPGMGRDVPRLSLPGKLVFPRYDRCHHSNSGWSASAVFVPSVPGVLLLLYHKVWFRHFGQRRRKWQASQQIPLVHSKFLKGWELFESWPCQKSRVYGCSEWSHRKLWRACGHSAVITLNMRITGLIFRPRLLKDLLKQELIFSRPQHLSITARCGYKWGCTVRCFLVVLLWASVVWKIYTK